MNLSVLVLPQKKSEKIYLQKEGLEGALGRGRKGSLQEREVAAHAVSVDERQRGVEAGAQNTSSLLFSLGLQPEECYRPS